MPFGRYIAGALGDTLFITLILLTVQFANFVEAIAEVQGGVKRKLNRSGKPGKKRPPN